MLFIFLYGKKQKENKMKINQSNQKLNQNLQQDAHLNHMHGISYDIRNPITQLRVMASSCFFGEPMYYHDYKKIEEKQQKHNKFEPYLDKVLTSIVNIPDYHSYSPSKLIETAIDEALNYDVEATLLEAVRLRQEENIRTTPQVIMVRAANHPNCRGTGLIAKYADKILSRTDEAAVQLAYQKQVFGKPIPNALKKAWKKFLETRTAYQLAKYRMENRQYKTVDVVNLVHAHSEPIDSLMKGTLKLSEEDTWEALISKNGSTTENWTKAVSLMGHMALLKNIRNFIKHSVKEEVFLPKLLETSHNSKMLPFEYFSAYKAVENDARGNVLDAIEKCLMNSLKELPKFKGKSISLCDNSGSAQNTTQSSLGTIKISDIGNLMATLTGKCSDDGYIGIFGDNLKKLPIRKNSSLFDDLKNINLEAEDIGASSENGIWLFFDSAITKKEIYDHIFVYSDMQAGHGGLYGNHPNKYKDYIYPNSGNHIDVAKLIKTYREKVNPNVFVYLVQIAGQKDTLVPSFYDRTYILGGWSDKLLRFADQMTKIHE